MLHAPIASENLSHLRKSFEITEDRMPQLTVDGMREIDQAGFGKIGYAFAIEDQLGRVFVMPHKQKNANGVAEGEIGPPSETVKGKIESEAITKVESIESCLVRCFLDEQGVDLREAGPEAELRLNRLNPLVIVDWPMHHPDTVIDTDIEPIKNTLGIVASFRANWSMTRHIETNVEDTLEAYPGSFRPIKALLGVVEKGEGYRPAFDLWLEQYRTYGPVSEPKSWVNLKLPEKLETEEGNWAGLRFSNISELV